MAEGGTELRFVDEPRGPDGKWIGGGGDHGALTKAEAEWIAKGEAAWKAHEFAKGKSVAAKAAGKPSLASYYKKQAIQHGEKAKVFTAKANELHKASKAEADAKAAADKAADDAAKAKAEAAKAHPAGSIDALHAGLLKKHEDAKAAGKPSLASYYKKKAAEYKAAKVPKTEEPKAAAPKPGMTADEAKTYDSLIAAQHQAEKNGKPDTAAYYKKLAADFKAHKEGKPTAPKLPGDHPAPKAPEAPKAPAADYSKYNQLMAKSVAAKAAGKPSMASYYKKKANEALPPKTDAPSGSPSAPSAQTMSAADQTHYDHLKAEQAKAEKAGKANAALYYKNMSATHKKVAEKAYAEAVAKNGDNSAKPSEQYSGHYLEGSQAPASVKEFVNAQTAMPLAGTHAGLANSPANAKNLTGDTRKAVISYTGAGYTGMNNALRGTSKMTPAVSAKVTAMDQAMKPLDKSMMVYRNTGNKHTFDGLKAGDIISDAGFHSTSIRKGVFASSTKTQMNIILPKGQKASWVQPISSHSSEDEMVLPRGQKYVVVTPVAIDGTGRTTIQLMAIPDDLLPGVNTKQAHPGKPHMHSLRAMLLDLAKRSLDEIQEDTT